MRGCGQVKSVRRTDDRNTPQTASRERPCSSRSCRDAHILPTPLLCALVEPAHQRCAGQLHERRNLRRSVLLLLPQNVLEYVLRDARAAMGFEPSREPLAAYAVGRLSGNRSLTEPG